MTDTRDSYLPLVSGDPVGAAARLAEQDAEIERLREQFKEIDEAAKFLLRKCSELEAERDALLKDAKRYRWLRQFILNADDTTFTFIPNVGTATDEIVDEAIDAARKE